MNIQCSDRNAGNAGSAQGSMYRTSNALIQRLRRMKKPDSRNARNIFTFTPMPTSSSVLITVVR